MGWGGRGGQGGARRPHPRAAIARAAQDAAEPAAIARRPGRPRRRVPHRRPMRERARERAGGVRPPPFLPHSLTVLHVLVLHLAVAQGGGRVLRGGRHGVRRRRGGAEGCERGRRRRASHSLVGPPLAARLLAACSRRRESADPGRRPSRDRRAARPIAPRLGVPRPSRRHGGHSAVRDGVGRARRARRTEPAQAHAAAGGRRGRRAPAAPGPVLRLAPEQASLTATPTTAARGRWSSKTARPQRSRPFSLLPLPATSWRPWCPSWMTTSPAATLPRVR